MPMASRSRSARGRSTCCWCWRRIAGRLVTKATSARARLAASRGRREQPAGAGREPAPGPGRRRHPHRAAVRLSAGPARVPFRRRDRPRHRRAGDGGERDRARPAHPAALARSLVGRDIELGAVRDALERERLVTLVGAAGVGKSRLAREILAVEHEHARMSSRPWSPLEPLESVDHVPSAIALALGVSMPEPRRPLPGLQAGARTPARAGRPGRRGASRRRTGRAACGTGQLRARRARPGNQPDAARPPWARRSIASGRCRPPKQPGCSRSAQRQADQRFELGRRQRGAWSRKSAAGSTGIRWRSSSRRPACRRSAWPRCWRASTTGSGCSRSPAGAGTSVTAYCRRHSTGATACSVPSSSACSTGSARLPAVSRSMSPHTPSPTSSWTCPAPSISSGVSWIARW